MATNFTPPAPLKTAVLMLVFNRPEPTARVFDAIRKAQPPRLYVAADGPRPGRAGEAKKVARVREIVTAVDWPCQVKTLFRSKNLGCQFGPRGGIDWFFKHEDFGIIIEDDCLPSQSFFWYCEDLLTRYRDDESIMAVSGTNISNELNFDGDYFFSKYPLMWGWASWRRAWAKYDPDLANWEKIKKRNWLRSLDLGGSPFVLTWERIFNQTVLLGNAATWWDFQWIYTCWINNGLTISPCKNLVKNIGFSEEATHTFSEDRFRSNLTQLELRFPLTHPISRRINRDFDIFITRHWFHATWLNLLKVYVLKIPGIKFFFKRIGNF